MSSPRPLKRARIACSACKQKKQKCDGNRPACGNCEKARRDCTIEDPGTKRQLPPDYIQRLEDRIAYLEGLLEDVRPDIAIDHLPANNLQVGNYEMDGLASEVHESSPDDARAPATSRMRGESSTNQIISAPLPSGGIETLCLNAAVGKAQYFGCSSVMSFAKTISLVLDCVRFQGPGLTMAGISNDTIRSLPKPIPAPLPLQLFGDLLSDAYFTHVHLQYPFLHRPTFRTWEANVQSANEAGTPLDPVEAYFVFMVYAIGALITPTYSPSSAESLYAAAELLSERVMEMQGLEFIQAILCCTMYSMRSSTGTSVWMLTGIALRQAIELGYHRRVSWLIEPDTLRIQMQRRVFWTAYGLDRAAAVSLGRPLGIAEDEIDVELPDDISDEDIATTGFLSHNRENHMQPPTTMSAAIHNLRMRRIWADIKTIAYPTTQISSSPQMRDCATEDLRQRLCDWLAECPQATPNPVYASSLPFGTSKWFSLDYHHSILLLYQQRLIDHSKLDFRQDPSMTAVYVGCAESASSLCTMYQELYLTASVSYTWGALHILYLAGLVFIYCLWVDPTTRQSYRRDTVTRICTACTVALAIMTERWTAAQPYRDSFRAFADATQSMLVELDENSNRNPAFPILQTSRDPRLPHQIVEMGAIGISAPVEHILQRMVG